MKVGTVSKITVGAAALIAVDFHRFRWCSSDELRPQLRSACICRRGRTVLRVHETILKDWLPKLIPPKMRKTGGTQPQVAAWQRPQKECSQLMIFFESILRTADMAQFAIEGESEPDIEQSLTTDTSTLLDDNGSVR